MIRVAVIALLLTPTLALAATEFTWQGAGTGGNTATDPADLTTNWNQPANWGQVSTLPGAADYADVFLMNEGTVNVNSPAAAISLYVYSQAGQVGMRIADGAALTAGEADIDTGTVQQTGGSFLSQYLYVYGGQLHLLGGSTQAGSISVEELGLLKVEGGSLSSSTTLTVGTYGGGSALQQGGTVLVTSTGGFESTNGLQIKRGGQYRLENGVLDVTNMERIDGRLVQVTGYHNIGYGLMLAGPYTSSTGVFDIQGGEVRVRHDVQTGYGQGTINQSGGNVAIQGNICLGSWQGGRGTWSMSGGTTVANRLHMGHYSSATYPSRGVFIQSGGVLSLRFSLDIAIEEAASGEYQISGGTMTSPSASIGQAGPGSFRQSGGSSSINFVEVGGYVPAGTGLLEMTGGTLKAGVMQVGVVGAGELTLTPAARLEVRDMLVVRDTGRLNCQPGSKVLMTGPAATWDNYSPTPANLSGMGNLTMAFAGGTGDWSTYEADGADRGFTEAAFDSNFALDRLVVGESGPTNLRLKNDHENQAGTDAVYVYGLTLAAGSTLDLAGMNLYCLGQFEDLGGMVINGSIIAAHPGDANVDRKVDVGDLGILAANWDTQAHRWTSADYTGDGVVNVGDLGVLAANWGWSGSPAGVGSSIPEPASLILLALGGLAIRRRRTA